MKHFTLILSGLITLQVGYSQARFGLSASAVLPKDIKYVAPYYHEKISFYIGVFEQLHISPHWLFQPELQYSIAMFDYFTYG